MRVEYLLWFTYLERKRTRIFLTLMFYLCESVCTIATSFELNILFMCVHLKEQLL